MKFKSEIRKAYLQDKYVIITPGRAKRPRDIKEETVIKRTAECPFCPGNIKNNILKDKIMKPDEEKKWLVASIDNIFPAVTLDNKRAYGSQEVIIETRRHTDDLDDLNIDEIEQVLRMYARRTEVMSKIDNIDYVLCFKNQGSKAGASIVHAHSQVFATDIIPPEVNSEIAAAQSYKIKHGTCPYCDIIKKEMHSERKIFEDRYVAAIAPYASEFHYEAWIFTKRHIDNITLMKPMEFRSFAAALKKILVKIGRLDLSFNYFLHQLISNHDQHLYLKIQPRDSIWAGIELGSGLIINSVSPETAAKYYRE
ncbi:hypothetical protein A2303_07050 [Candidatus Falkowbacteria bacterium RIFOXYB2_FULL_47_14]|uniref:Galactose-1-phosphate uridyl transferase N-terminal domain-containing protein n=1 Tax=Candidatus Falkowbacteria bacterium RIFOXYA2_FULL_47_19 TaxID=1797994 RepID=A0A1F5SG78_9BACT|nr:MAG: hypothetical protein A2227_00795 [Candidatus Falkowbacteria bacterium RIFOXYA2_FULL_47_19]OGF34910.1 MAG: hypothetical protein A2468_06755 [Candidatus Falkowbacteria bacterium RIFOXYC2_FULL_46_15]OGF43625.1 MAG: hypothetical protein A2303_07050 [Candidatus Falkowbacteria bacterium RIFOXYB2_FULL_47_14]